METYQEYQARIKEDQKGLSKEEIIDSLQAEYTLDLNSLPNVTHNWVKRGIKVSCEGSGHPCHSHYLTGK